MSNNIAALVNEIGGVLKRNYEAPILDQMNKDCFVYKFAEKTKMSVSGEATYFPLKLARAQGTGFGSDGGVLPSIGRPLHKQAKVDHKFSWFRIALTSGLVAASKNDKGAFVRYAKTAVEGATEDFIKEQNRVLSWDGTGYLGRLSAAAVASNSISVQGREGTSEEGGKFIFPDMEIDIVSSAGVYKANGATVTAVTNPLSTTATVTLDQAVTASSGDYIVRKGSYNMEAQGLTYSINGDTTSIYDIDRSLYRAYQSNLLNMNGAQLSIDGINVAFLAGIKRGGVTPGAYQKILMDFDTSRFYTKLLTPDRRYNDGANLDAKAYDREKINGTLNGVEIMADPDCPQRIFFIPQGVLKLCVLNELEMATETGSQMIPIPETDSWEMRMRYFYNLFNTKPSSCSAIYNYISP